MNISNNVSSLVPSRSIVCIEISANKNTTADTKRKGARSTRLGTRLQILEKVGKQKLRLF